MWLELSARAYLAEGDGTHLSAVSDLVVAPLGGGPALLVSDRAEGAVSAFALGPGGSLVPLAAIAGHAALAAVEDLTLLPFPDGLRLGVAGRGAEGSATYDLTTGTLLSQHETLSGPLWSGLETAAVTPGGNRTLLVAAQRGTPGLEVHQLANNGKLAPLHSIPDTPDLPLGDVTALAVWDGKNDLIYAASAFDAGIAAFTVKRTGELLVESVVEPGPKAAFGRITALEFVEAGALGYLVAADAATGSLLLFKARPGGKLKHLSTVSDGAETAIAGATEIAGFTGADGKPYVAVSGAEGGVSIFLIDALPRIDRLKHVGTAADDPFDPMGPVGALTVTTLSGETIVAVGSAAGHGLRTHALTLTRPEVEVIGGRGDDALQGTGVDELLYGSHGADVIRGGGGDDLLIDGRASDTLTGGAGADVFELWPDDATEEITDFELGLDRIDLSAFPRLHGLSGLEINPRSFGANVFVGAEKLVLRSADGATLEAADLAEDVFIFL
ncbi:MAG: hypothetical protein AAFW69_01590 [Pseudomonadota bacterium]